MNWSKAKNIIIAVLIFTNLFILFMTFLRYEQVQSDDSEVYKYTEDILKANNIYMDCEIPESIGRMHALTISYGKYDADMAEDIMENTSPLPEDERSDADYREAAGDFIERCGYMDENAKAVSVDKSGEETVVTYKNYYKEIPLEECYMKVTFKDGKIVGFDRKWMECVSEGSTRIEIMPPVSSLLSFMTEIREEYDESYEIRINDMYITYWIDSYSIDGDVLYDTALPAWCILYNGDKIKYISAIVQ